MAQYTPQDLIDNLNYLNETKQLIKSSIINKGQEIDDNDTFRSYADKIDNIATDTTATENDITINKSAYVNGNKVIGTYDINDTYKNILYNYIINAVEGETIHITDSANLPMFLKPQGQIIQDTRNGYNLLEVTTVNTSNFGLSIINNNDGSVILNGTATATSGALSLLKNNTSFPLSNLPYDITFTTRETLPEGVVLAIAYGDEEGRWISNIGVLNSNSNVLNVTRNNVPENAKYVRFNFTITVNTTLNNLKITPMLLDGTYTAETLPEYEQYGKKPSTNFPSSIKKVEGDYNCNIRNKNFISSNINDWEEGHYSIEGLKEPYANRFRLKKMIKVQPDTAYYAHAFSNTYSLVIREHDKNKNITNNIGGIENKGKTFKTKKNTEFLSIAVYNQADMTESFPFSLFEKLLGNGEIKPFMCLNSEIDKSYIESEQQIKAVELPENVKLYGKEDGFIYLTEEQATELELVDGEGWYVYNEWGEIVIVGTEHFIEIESIRTPKTYVYQFDYTKLMSPTNNNVIGAKCNYFNENTANNIWSTKTNLEAFSLNINHTLHIRTEIAPDLFKTWLEEKNTEGNPLKVVGKLVNPAYTKITDSTLISQLETLKKVFSHYPVTNIDSVSENENAPIYFNVTYFKIK